MVQDYSFLKLSTSINAAIASLGLPNHIDIYDFSFITLGTVDITRMITSSNVDVVFNSDYKTELVTLCDDLVKDITANTAVYELTDSETGIKQIGFEIVNIGTVYPYLGVPMLLKFTHTTGTEVFYSVPFHVSDDLKWTSVLDFKATHYYQNTDYINAPFSQRIRLKNYQDGMNNETQKETYVQANGNTVQKHAIARVSYNYEGRNASFNTIDSLLNALESGIVYIDGYRMTTCTAPEIGKRIGQTNVMPVSFKAYLNKNDVLLPSYQIFAPFSLVSTVPTGSNVLGSTSSFLVGTFSAPLILGAGSITVYDSLGAVLATYTAVDNIGTGNLLVIDMTGLISATGDYYVQSQGLFYDGFGNLIEITNTTDWAFSVIHGDWLSTDWDPADWLIY